MKKRALFSLHRLDKVEKFAKLLCELGWEIIASKETVKVLTKKRIKVTNIADFLRIKDDFGFPPTLHPRVETLLTSSKGERIDLAYVIPYPISVGNDVGGRTLLALAAKGNRIPVMTVQDMQDVVIDLKNNGKISGILHSRLLDKVHASIARHYGNLIKKRLPHDLITGSFKYSLLNGENPYQVPAELFSLEQSDGLSISNFRQLSGEVPCFVNLADAESIIYTLCLASEAFRIRYKKIPYICIAAKHGNACGMGVSWSNPNEAINKALFASPRAIWGGEVVVNFTINKREAELLFKNKKREDLYGNAAWMLDIIIAPRFTKEAIPVLSNRKMRKLLENKALFSPVLSKTKYVYRFLRGGFLRQPPNNYVLDFKETEPIGLKLSNRTIDSLIIAWSIAWSSNHGGNEIAIAKNSQLLSVGGGPSTVEAAYVAVTRSKRCGHNLIDSVFAANAFFPFIDAPKILAGQKVMAGLVPAGGRSTNLVKNFLRKKNIRMVYLPEQYRGFSRH